MSGLNPAGSKRPRGRYSRLICLGCRERRIRCELPSDVEVPDPGELQPVETPCYRCKRLGIACIVRQTILGRPRHDWDVITAAELRHTSTRNVVSRIVVELSPQAVAYSEPTAVLGGADSITSSSLQLDSSSSFRSSAECEDSTRRGQITLLIHKPQSVETILIIRAIDTLRREQVEEEWFRHLPAYVGHTEALDLSIKALVAACAYSRGESRLTSGDCYQALALALHAVQLSIKLSHGNLDDDLLAATALLAPFDGVVNKNGVPTLVHVEGLAAILAARTTSSHVTELARDIIGFYAGETAIMACIHDMHSPFANIDRAYFASDWIGCSQTDGARLRALSNELFIHVPQLVKLVRSLQSPAPARKRQLRHAFALSESLLESQDDGTERQLSQKAVLRSPKDVDEFPSVPKMLHFASVQDFEALASYWQTRLSLLRLEWHLRGISKPIDVERDSMIASVAPSRPSSDMLSREMLRLAKNLVMCLEFARTLPLNRQIRVFAHAIVTVWGVIMDLPEAFRHVQDGYKADSLPDLLIRRLSIALSAKPDFKCQDMNEAAEIFVGGQRECRFARLFGS